LSGPWYRKFRREEKRSDGPTFGTHEPLLGSFRGLVYRLGKYTSWLPDFRNLSPIRVYYTNALNYDLRQFDEEWFGIDYQGAFFVKTPGVYRFFLESDDGAQLFIDGKRIINNDGIHAVQEEEVDVSLTAGQHTIRVPYFQGPQPYVSLVLKVKPPKEKKQVFDMTKFRPPTEEHPADERPSLKRR
jgi:hypothetical protein